MGYGSSDFNFGRYRAAENYLIRFPPGFGLSKLGCPSLLATGGT
jgi:hypothetical protein